MISEKEVDHIALLSRLELKDSERKKLTSELNLILEYVEKLKELDTDVVPPTSHTLPIKNVFREDKVTDSLPINDTLRNAPDSQDNCFRVPKIIQ